MKLEQTFTVHAQPTVVWEALVDVARVAPCLPGAAITGQEDDGSYKGEFKVKLGPTTAAYNGVLKMTSVDDAGQVATMDARGTDKRGQGGATATIVSSVHAGDGAGETRVDIVTDFAITGRLARFGRGGMVQDVANRLLREFAANLEALLQAEGAAGTAVDEAPPTAVPAGDVADAGTDEPTGAGTGTGAGASAASPPPRPAFTPPAAEPVSGTAVLFGALADRAKREPAQAGAVVAVLLLLVMLLRRSRGDD
jgi:carbon monoxide dehydrogenase subunit G